MEEGLDELDGVLLELVEDGVGVGVTVTTMGETMVVGTRPGPSPTKVENDVESRGDDDVPFVAPPLLWAAGLVTEPDGGGAEDWGAADVELLLLFW